MSIAVALAFPTAAAVASDMREILHGVATDNHEKTFEYRSETKQIAGVIAGTLFDGATRMTTVLRDVCAGVATLEEAAQRCADRLAAILPKQNGIDVALVAADDLGFVGPPKLIHVHFLPGNAEPTGAAPRVGQITPKPYNWYFGGSGAKDVGDVLTNGWDDMTIGTVAVTAVERAVAAAKEPGGDGLSGGSPSLLVLKFRLPPAEQPG